MCYLWHMTQWVTKVNRKFYLWMKLVQNNQHTRSDISSFLPILVHSLQKESIKETIHVQNNFQKLRYAYFSSNTGSFTPDLILVGTKLIQLWAFIKILDEGVKWSEVLVNEKLVDANSVSFVIQSQKVLKTHILSKILNSFPCLSLGEILPYSVELYHLHPWL